MIVSCPSCSAKYQYDENRFGEAVTKKLKCSKCGVIFEVARPASLSADGRTSLGPLPVPAQQPSEQTSLLQTCPAPQLVPLARGLQAVALTEGWQLSQALAGLSSSMAEKDESIQQPLWQ
jgi:predicted Zn finger-like uncharacterized protein